MLTINREDGLDDGEQVNYDLSQHIYMHVNTLDEVKLAAVRALHPEKQDKTIYENPRRCDGLNSQEQRRRKKMEDLARERFAPKDDVEAHMLR